MAPSLRCSEDAGKQPTAEKTASKRFKTQFHTSRTETRLMGGGSWLIWGKKDKKGKCGHPALSLALSEALPNLTSTRGALALDQCLQSIGMGCKYRKR